MEKCGKQGGLHWPTAAGGLTHNSQALKLISFDFVSMLRYGIQDDVLYTLRNDAACIVRCEVRSELEEVADV